MCDGVLHCLCFVFIIFLVSLCMAINVSVEYNGGLLPDIILLTQWLLRGFVLAAFDPT